MIICIATLAGGSLHAASGGDPVRMQKYNVRLIIVMKLSKRVLTSTSLYTRRFSAGDASVTF